MTVAERLKQLAAKRAQVCATPCVGCGHAWIDHNTGRCWYPRTPVEGATNCRCRHFIDPDETP